MRSVLLSLLVAGCQACESSQVSGLEPRWTVAPEQLELGEVSLGEEGTALLTVQNESRSPLELELSVQEPFAGPASVRLGGGSSTTVEVHFRPTLEGAVSANLQVTDGSRTAAVVLLGRGRAVPDCGPPSLCHERRFDPARAACVEDPLPDGTACASMCLIAASCQRGVCTGAARDCSDGNACTSDSCDERLGCRNDAVTCPASTSPCLTAVCHPRTGCAFEPVLDGASCGENDCTTAHVCIDGVCEARASPEGSECAPADVCRAASVCENRRCVAGPMTPPVARWTYLPAGKRVFFEGTVSPEGIAYFTEAPLSEAAEPLELVGIDPLGVERLRVELEPACPGCTARLALDPLNGIIFAGRRGRLQARDARDGGVLWSRDTTLGKTPRSPQRDGGGLWSTSAFLSISEDLIVEQLTEGTELHREYSIALDRRSGAVAWERDWWGHVYFPAVTASGSLVITNADCWAPIQQSQLFDHLGRPERTVARQARPVGVEGDRVLLAGADLVWSSPSGLSGPISTQVRNPIWALSAPGRVVLAGYQSLAELDGDGGTRWHRNTTSTLLTAALIDDGGVLFGESTNDGGSLLRRLGPDGTPGFTCALPGYVNATAALHRGLFIAPLSRGTTGVAAFEVGDLELATQGWVMPNGSTRGDRRALPRP
ncbi:MAG: hypothetical protein JNJ54_08840 [Myxococcaceae bacterium]|nr:hypothetical protein [Myxococcaceae bacterium]